MKTKQGVMCVAQQTSMNEMRWKLGSGCLLAALLLIVTNHVQAADKTACPALLDHTTTRLAETAEVSLCDEFADKVVLVVNTASRCGFTSQYGGLEALYAKYKEQGFIVAGFPSNDFAGQEPGNEEQIKSFCRTTYGVQFPMYAKSHVRGDAISPFYAALVAESNDKPNWNFHKYLIDRNGKVVESYSSFTGPDSEKLIEKIESLL